ncbi:MAG: alkaline phosphatase family protein [Gammaproteobacteria bacterium]|nr:alkaline phosphatase family protein [Gammaproteobacteria bacterium]MDH3413276.1 alkaline phosphatase family protein [Gammaproteobacteria bacterium]
MPLPDYSGNGIVNLMTSIVAGLGPIPAEPRNGDRLYKPHSVVTPDMLEASKHVVLMVFDGLGYGYLRRRIPDGALSAGLNAPMTSVFPSTTTSAISTFLTADAPQQHGLTGWYIWLREIGMVASPLPFRSRPGSKLLGSFGLRPGTLFDRRSVFDQIDRDCFMVQPATLWDSPYTRAHTGSAMVKPYRKLKQMFARIRRITASRKPSFTYAYWPELDTLGHRHGMESESAVDHLAEIDQGVADLLDVIQRHDVCLIVTADHGFVDTDEQSWVELSGHPELGATLAVPLCGEPRAAYCYVHPDRRDEFEGYVRERLSHQCDLHKSEDLFARGYFGHGIPHPRLRERIGHYCLIMKGNYAIRDRLETEKHGKNMIGVHGGVSDAEMLVPLALFQG